MSRKVARRKPETGFSSDLPDILNHIYQCRGISDAGQLDLSLGKLLPPDTLKDCEQATSLLSDAIIHGSKILVVADFDADGATSCALMLSVLQEMGAAQVDYLVPNRFDFGYGLTTEIVEVAMQGKPDLLVTVDNGISSVNGVKLAREKGAKVLITDHHLAPEQLPEADAILNPNQPGCDFPSKAIAGVGVAFYLLSMTRRRLREVGWFANNGLKEPKMSEYLDLVALGTVADVVPLDYNNRILVSEGVRRIRAGNSRPGIKALIEVSRRSAESLNASDLGFSIGPRLNAAGRLEDMSLGIECLLTNDMTEARELATRLSDLNVERREIESRMKEQAERDLARAVNRDEDLPFGLSLYDEQWHQGVVGILASRIKEQVHRPVVAFANESDSNKDQLKGSGRSVPGFHIRDALANIHARYPGMMNKFGGHAMAAGLTLSREHLPDFRQAFDDEVRSVLSTEDLQGVIFSDGELAADEFTLEFARLLERSGPWGQDFPQPVFDGDFEIVDQRIVGEKHLKLKIRPTSSEKVIEGIWFNAGGLFEHRQVHMTYQLDVNEFRGRQSLQFIVNHMQPKTNSRQDY